MDDQNKNLILATALSFLVILVWFLLFPPPEPEPMPETSAVEQSDGAPTAGAPIADGSAPLSADAQVGTGAEPVADTPRIAIDTPRLSGSVSLLGGRIDELFLKDYRVSLDDNSDIVELLKPVGTPNAYYALYGWAPGAGATVEDVPGARTEWQIESGETLAVDSPVTLVWQNGSGLTFRRTLAVDEDYMFTITQSVENASGAPVSLAPYGVIARHGTPPDVRRHAGGNQIQEPARPGSRPQ